MTVTAADRVSGPPKALVSAMLLKIDFGPFCGLKLKAGMLKSEDKPALDLSEAGYKLTAKSWARLRAEPSDCAAEAAVPPSTPHRFTCIWHQGTHTKSSCDAGLLALLVGAPKTPFRLAAKGASRVR